MKKILIAILLLLSYQFTQAQNVGIGTTTPVARLHVSDSNVLFTGPSPFVNYNPPQLPPIQGAGTRLMWYPQKGAFRVGWVEDDRWNKDSIGIFSMAFGHSTLAQNTGSVALGVRTNAKGMASMATGWGSSANADYSYASGFFSTANGINSTAIGTQALTSNYFAISIGNNTVASGNTAVALGDSSIASGSASLAAGSYVTAKGRASVTLGGWNDNTDNPDPVFSAATDRIFQLGNGDAFLATRRNALTVLRNGHTGIGITDPRFPLSFGAGNGDKISFYDDGNPAELHFGIGVTFGQLMQVHSATPLDDIAFGTGKSGAFIESMRIKGNRKIGINTTNPLATFHVADSGVIFTGSTFVPITTSFGPPVQGAGTRMMWYPEKGAFRTGEVSGTEWDMINVGRHSFVAGKNSIAKGESAIAIGFLNIAVGDYALAMGNSSVASGSGAIAIGQGAKAGGFGATATGYGTIARSDFSFVTGRYNDTTATNRIFEVGNGTADNARNNAITVLQNGSTLITAPASLPVIPDNPPASGAGNRMMWYADKAAFRAGNVINNSWDKDNIGNVSFAVGSNTQASGITSFASGTFSFATGETSTAMGFSVQARAKGAAAFGIYNDITDNPNPGFESVFDRIFQVGNGTTNLARKNAITVLRNGNVGIGNISPAATLSVTGTSSISEFLSIGSLTASPLPRLEVLGSAWFAGSGYYSSFFTGAAEHTYLRGGKAGSQLFLNDIPGAGYIITGNNLGIGNTNPIRPLSFPASLGEKILLYPGGAGEVGIGVYGNELRLHADNPGAKVSFGTQTNAGVFTEAGKFEISGGYALSVFGSIWANGTTYTSDERFKKNITSINSPLQRLLQINGVEYEMRSDEFTKNNFTNNRQMGLLAQNVEKVVPEAVNELDGYKGVDYARLVPLLIESIKELNKKIEEQHQEIELLKATKKK